MHLVDNELESVLGDIVYPYCEDQLSVDSYDIRLSNEFYRLSTYVLSYDGFVYDPQKNKDNWTKHVVDKKLNYIDLEPHEFVLASTIEWLKIPKDMSAELVGKSSCARDGIIIQNAGHIEPGFNGNLTLEIFNCLPIKLRLYPGELIGQLLFCYVSQPRQPYGENNHYKYQHGPKISIGGLSKNRYKKCAPGNNFTPKLLDE